MDPMRVILVDDNPDFLKAALNFLTEQDLEVSGIALSTPDLLEEVARRKPDLVLMDIATPDMNGLKATRLLKMQADPPLVILTSLADDPPYIAAARAAGADGFVSKNEFSVQLLPLIDTLFPDRVHTGKREG